MSLGICGEIVFYESGDIPLEYFGYLPFQRLPRLSWELDLRPGDSGSTLRDGLLHVNGFA